MSWEIESFLESENSGETQLFGWIKQIKFQNCFNSYGYKKVFK